MMKMKIKILLLVFFGLLNANRIPENGTTFNHTQLFFRWDQIPHALHYSTSILDLETNEELVIKTKAEWIKKALINLITFKF